MGISSYGAKVQPQFASGGNPPTFAADLTEVSNYAGYVGNRVADTSAMRLEHGAWNGLEWYETDTGLTYTHDGAGWNLTGGDTRWSLGPISLAGGWDTLTDPNGALSSVAGGVRRIGKYTEISFRCARNGATITAGSAGNITDTLVGTLATDFRPDRTVYGHFSVGPGVASGGCRVGTDGTLYITDMYPTATIADNDVIQFDAQFLVN